MGIIRGLVSTWKKSEAAVVVQNLLEPLAATGLFTSKLTPAEYANKLVGDVWTKMPDVFDGRFGQRPHKISVAAAAISHSLVHFHTNDNGPALIIALGEVFKEIGVNGSFYPLNSMDQKLLLIAVEVYLQASGDTFSDQEKSEIAKMVLQRA